ncbi:receptor-like protein 33 [Neltuma alba]|uniref:receptor-like protein 33 n=1 Tax=Neltuma alba TaxID=207710 RepID=UPI0010A2D017|nr:receptor-like protein 33 [Prosopis alba]
MRTSLVLWPSFFFCYYWACLSFNVSLVSGGYVPCLDQQKMLLQLKKNVKFNPAGSRKLLLWNESSPCNEWRGVSWDEEGHVAGLDLSGESISGGLDNSNPLFSLRHLKHLNLAFNNFNSVIPSRIKDLKSLTSLNLSNAGFVEQIPMDVARLTRLTILDLSTSYYLGGSSLKLENPNLVRLVRNLSEVRELYLDGINMALQGNKWGHALSSFLPHLQVLSMSSCNLSGPIDSSMEKLQNLSIIRLGQNNLSGAVPSFFANFPNLTQLDLSSCNLSGRFPNKIFQVRSLTSLDLSYNYGLQGSLTELPQSGSLQTLILSGTSFSGALPPSIRNLWKLSRLDISACQFNGTLPDSMLDLPELTYLDLSFNNFTGTVPSFGMAKKLIHIDLSQNNLNGGVSSALFKGLVKLVSINLQSNSLNGSIPMSLFLLPLLRSIQFSNNLFQGHIDAISNVSSSMLQVLDLSYNNLRGPIPQFIFHLKGLKVLQLSSNKFNDTIRLDMFGRLQNLTTLDLSNNSLSINANVENVKRSLFPSMTSLMLASCNLRQFPGFLRNMSRLTKLDLSKNEIAEKIPRWIWELGYLGHLNLSHNLLRERETIPYNLSSYSKLYVLDLHHNYLHGTLPLFPMLASYLDYSFNEFSSVIPPDIGNYLSFTIYLSLSHNALYERIPVSICNASNLRVLDLSYNNFSGGIPDCLAKSETLGVLDLGKNNLSGNISDTFQTSCTLKTLDLSSNNLEGPIPKSLSNCITLELLNIGNNKMDDGFPCMLKTIPTLRVMVLRRNNFHGPIGCPNMKRMTWKMLQIVDLAFNNFNGTLPRRCFPTWKAMMLDRNKTASKANQIIFSFFGFGQVKYQDRVIVTMKGQEITLIKILTVFTSIDLSSNRIEGSIPEEMMDFTALHGLNLSNNNFTGRIPSSIGKLEQLESLDLSNNSFAGEIPSQLANLSFLSFLNLSYNHFVGKIPTGTQLQTFDSSSFVFNQGLCGPPLRKCSTDESISTNRSTSVVYADSGVEFDWQFVFKGVGFGVGSGLVVALLMLWDKGRIWSNNCIDRILLLILTKIDSVCTPTRVYEAEDDTEEHKSDMADENDHRNKEACNFNDLNFRGKYCVFCSHLDMSMKKAIHDPRCTCLYSPTISPSTCSSKSNTDSS